MLILKKNVIEIINVMSHIKLVNKMNVFKNQFFQWN